MFFLLLLGEHESEGLSKKKKKNCSVSLEFGRWMIHLQNLPSDLGLFKFYYLCAHWKLQQHKISGQENTILTQRFCWCFPSCLRYPVKKVEPESKLPFIVQTHLLKSVGIAKQSQCRSKATGLAYDSSESNK